MAVVVVVVFVVVAVVVVALPSPPTVSWQHGSPEGSSRFA